MSKQSAPPSAREVPPWLVLTVCCVAQFMATLAVSIVNVALPEIRESLGFSASDLQWVVNAYAVTFAGFLLLGGRLIDLLGRRRVFLAGIVLFTAASLLGGLAPNSGTLVVARALQGLGAAVVTPASLAVLSTSFPDPRERGRAIGIWGAVAGAGGAFGALAGGALTKIDWRWTLLADVPIGVLVAAGTIYAIHDRGTATKRGNLDIPGALAVTGGVLALVYGLVQPARHGWGSAYTLGPVAVGLVLLALFAVIETRWATTPLMRLGILSSRPVWSANIVAFASGAVLFAMFYFVTLHLQYVAGYSPLKTGFAYLPLAFAIIVLARLAPPLVTRYGTRAALTTGMALIVVGLAWLSRLDADATYAADILVPSILVGAGQGLVMASSTIAGTSGVAPHETGLASGLLNATRQLGGAIGLAALTTVANSRAEDRRKAAHAAQAGRDALASGYALALGVGAVLAAVGLLAAMLAPGRTRNEEPAGRPARADQDHEAQAARQG